MLKTFAVGGINWMWYVCAEFDEEKKTAHIYYHTRFHNERSSKHPKSEIPSIGGVRLIEDEKRIVTGIKLEDKEYKVTNPLYIFDYNDFSKLVFEE